MDENAARRVVALDDCREPDLVNPKPDDYDAVYVRHVCLRIFRASKVRVDFRLLAHPGITLSRWYRAEHSRGRIHAGNNSDIVRELSAVLGHRVRRDRIPLGELAGRVVRVRVRTVTTDSRQDALAQVNQYSVIAKLLECTQ
jgi:hypothetical protein